jgi:hypothetical protein
MILRELFYFDRQTMEPTQDDRYDPAYDDSIVSLDDIRKTRLTLRQINRVRKSAEIHTQEKEKELDFVRQMYGAAAQEEAEGGML